MKVDLIPKLHLIVFLRNIRTIPLQISKHTKPSQNKIRAKISQGILGGVSGTVGNVVGGSWKGINYLRVRAQHFQDAKTEGQVGQRAKFGAYVALAKSFLDKIRRN
jgi:hypothetical protein